MYILIHHDIKDSTTFWDLLEKAEKDFQPPPGLTPFPVFYPTTDGKSAFCMYKADSLEALRDFVDNGLGETSVNSYYTINEEIAQGLPG